MVYFKQYGSQRSGTNYLKRLIELNFEDTVVFGSVLGWKHGMYETGNGYRYVCDSHESWIDKQTQPNGAVHSVDNYALKYTADQLIEASSQLNYLISVKDPYAYVVSYKRFRAAKQPWSQQQVIKWLDQYLLCYSRWRELYNNKPHRCHFVNYEQLVQNKDIVLSCLKQKFSLVSKHDSYVDEHKIVDASTDHGLLINKKQFNAAYYTNRQYMQEIPQDIKTTVTDKLKNHPVKLRC